MWCHQQGPDFVLRLLVSKCQSELPRPSQSNIANHQIDSWGCQFVLDSLAGMILLLLIHTSTNTQKYHSMRQAGPSFSLSFFLTTTPVVIQPKVSLSGTGFGPGHPRVGKRKGRTSRFPPWKSTKEGSNYIWLPMCDNPSSRSCIFAAKFRKLLFKWHIFKEGISLRNMWSAESFGVLSCFNGKKKPFDFCRGGGTWSQLESIQQWDFLLPWGDLSQTQDGNLAHGPSCWHALGVGNLWENSSAAIGGGLGSW